MSTYPRKSTDEDKVDIAETTFPGVSVNALDFKDVWMLAPFINELDFNCFSWSIQDLVDTFSYMPDSLGTLEHLVRHAKQRYGGPVQLYVPTDSIGAADAAIIAWGSGNDHIRHISRICTKTLLQNYAAEP